MSRTAIVVSFLVLVDVTARADPVTDVVESHEQPQGALAWFKLGVDLARQGEYVTARRHFERARSLAPNWALPHLEIAVIHLMTDNDREAIGHGLAEASRLGPAIPRARYLYGVFLQEQGRSSRAVEELLRALELRPSLLDARFRLATLFVEQGQQERGVQQYELVLQQRPSHLGAHRNLAVIFEHSGQLEQAEKHLVSITRLEPANAWHLTNLGRFYERVGWADKAERTFRHTRRLEPNGDRRRLRPLLKSRN